MELRPSYFLPFFADAKAKGVAALLAPTVTARSSFKTANCPWYVRLSDNQFLISGATGKRYDISDRAGDARNDSPTATSSATWCRTDTILSTDAGHDVLAAIDRQAITAAFGP